MKQNIPYGGEKITNSQNVVEDDQYVDVLHILYIISGQVDLYDINSAILWQLELRWRTVLRRLCWFPWLRTK